MRLFFFHKAENKMMTTADIKDCLLTPSLPKIQQIQQTSIELYKS